MAGSPQKRARKARAAEALNGSNAPAHDTHARAPARGGTPAAPAVGPSVRQMLDARQADALEDLASALTMGCPVRIDRIRPAWCSGWVEDTDVDVGDLGDLYGYLQSEWGGQQYRVTALHVDGRPLMAVKLKVAGPPRQNGRLIIRSRWEAATAGEELPTGAPDPVTAPAAAGVPAFNPLEFIQFFATEQRAAAAEARASVREVADLHSRDVQQLMQHITTKDVTDAQENSLVGQIETLSDGMQAVEKLRDTVASTLPAPEETEPERSGVINTAVEAMVVESLRSSVHQPDSPTPQASRARVVRPNGAQQAGGIPPAATRQRSS